MITTSARIHRTGRLALAAALAAGAAAFAIGSATIGAGSGR